MSGDAQVYVSSGAHVLKAPFPGRRCDHLLEGAVIMKNNPKLGNLDSWEGKLSGKHKSTGDSSVLVSLFLEELVHMEHSNYTV